MEVLLPRVCSCLWVQEESWKKKLGRMRKEFIVGFQLISSEYPLRTSPPTFSLQGSVQVASEFETGRSHVTDNGGL